MVVLLKLDTYLWRYCYRNHIRSLE